MDPSAKVVQIIEDAAASLGLDLILVTFVGGRVQTLQIMAENPDGTMLVDDCAKLSREVSALLDVEDPIAGEYLLEVSSPGIDRPLTRAKDFVKWSGFDIKIELRTGNEDGRRRFKGRLNSLVDGIVHMTTVEGEDVAMPFDDMLKAKLLLSDELLKAATNGFKGYPAEQGAKE